MKFDEFHQMWDIRNVKDQFLLKMSKKWLFIMFFCFPKNVIYRHAIHFDQMGHIHSHFREIIVELSRKSIFVRLVNSYEMAVNSRLAYILSDREMDEILPRRRCYEHLNNCRWKFSWIRSSAGLSGCGWCGFGPCLPWICCSLGSWNPRCSVVSTINGLPDDDETSDTIDF